MADEGLRRRRLVWSLAAASPLLAPGPCAALPSRLVLALDGAAYHHVRAAQEGAGGRRCLAGLPPAARLVAPYPSLSDPAWSDIFGLARQDGYQPLHYRYARNAVEGARGFAGMGDEPEYARRMDWHLQGSWLNLAGYLFPRRMLRYELSRARRAFFRSERPAFHAFLQTFDYAVHMGRDPHELLCEVDAWLTDLRREHAARGGGALELLLLSDHGTDDSLPRRVPVPEHLRRRGLRVVERLERRGDVVVPTDGMLNTFQVYPFPEDVPAVAAVLVELPGVDLVTSAVPGRPGEVRVLKRGEEALVRARAGRYAYVPLRGDPLRHACAAASLRRSGRADREGFAGADAWLEATAAHEYPVALERITRAHGGLVNAPAPVIVSLLPGHVNVDRLTWLLSHLVKLGGTHGALDARSSNGAVLWSRGRLPDTTTDRVRRHVGGFAGF